MRRGALLSREQRALTLGQFGSSFSYLVLRGVHRPGAAEWPISEADKGVGKEECSGDSVVLFWTLLGVSLDEGRRTASPRSVYGS